MTVYICYDSRCTTYDKIVKAVVVVWHYLNYHSKVDFAQNDYKARGQADNDKNYRIIMLSAAERSLKIYAHILGEHSKHYTNLKMYVINEKH